MGRYKFLIKWDDGSTSHKSINAETLGEAQRLLKVMYPHLRNYTILE